MKEFDAPFNKQAGRERTPQWFGLHTEQQTELSAVAKTAIYMMDTVTAMANRIIRWLDKGLGGPQ